MNGSPVDRFLKEGEAIGQDREGFLEKMNLELDLGARIGCEWLLAGSSLFKWEENRLWMLTASCVIVDRATIH